MSSESGSKEDGSVMEDPSGCLADKTANLSTRPSRPEGEHRIGDLPLRDYYCRPARVGQERADLQKACSNEVSDCSKPDLRLNLTSRRDKRGHVRNLWRQAGVALLFLCFMTTYEFYVQLSSFAGSPTEATTPLAWGSGKLNLFHQ